ncbi:hypothetical protein PSAB6_70082 [Paraburkholderia sabiae]|nr:hypothetical protein PSAB6_70082 [Paraburkholderia sabiae]
MMNWSSQMVCQVTCVNPQMSYLFINNLVQTSKFARDHSMETTELGDRMTVEYGERTR